MAVPTSPAPEVLALGIGGLLALTFAIWIVWRIGRFLVKVALLLLLLAATAALVRWGLSGH